MQLFDLLRSEQPDFARKIIPLEGELTEPNLGLSDSDIERMVETYDFPSILYV